jgi:hypothetical protein
MLGLILGGRFSQAWKPAFDTPSTRAMGGNRKAGLVHAHEPEDPVGIVAVSRAEPSRFRLRSGWNNGGGKPGRGFEDVSLQPELTCLAPKPGQLCMPGRSQVGVGRNGLHLPSALLPISLHNPVPDRLGRGFEPASQVGRVTPGSNQLDHLAPEFRHIQGTGLRHGGTSCESISAVHRTGAKSSITTVTRGTDSSPSPGRSCTSACTPGPMGHSY